MDKNDAIVNPVKGKKSPDLGPVSVMVSSQTDMDQFRELTNPGQNHHQKLMMSTVHFGEGPAPGISVAGPVVGAPYAVMLLEPLIAWGARKIIFFGWCGAISHKVKIGDIILPTGAIIDEGTSGHYQADENEITRPSDALVQKTKEVLRKKKLAFHEGVIWSTDAIYRETREKVEHFQEKEVLAVEMELSALFAVGKFRGVEVGGILVVSDELSTLKWQTGFKDKRFRQARRAATEVIKDLCRIL